MRLYEVRGLDQKDELLKLFYEFLKLCKEELVLDKLPKINWVINGSLDREHNSFGSFHNEDQVITVEISNRHPLDIMRTLAHELTHYRQYLDGEIKPHSGDDGSDQENEAHAVAGIIMRRFDREHPETFRFKPIEESWSKKYKKSINCSHPKGFSQKAHCAGRKARKAGRKTKSKSVSEALVDVNYGIGKNPGKLVPVGKDGKVPHAKLHVNVTKKTALKLGIPHDLNENSDISEAKYTTKQQVINHFVAAAKKKGDKDLAKAARRGAAAWERGWRGGNNTPSNEMIEPLGGRALLPNKPHIKPREPRKVEPSEPGVKVDIRREKPRDPEEFVYKKPQVKKNDENLEETRQGAWNYLKNLLPNWPEYVLRDWLYRGLTKGGNPTQAIEEMLTSEGMSPDTKWTYVPNFEFKINQLHPDTQRNIKSRAGGLLNPFNVPKDAERHAIQSTLAKKEGGIRKEPVIGKMTSEGFELIEGWHRTIQHFKEFPNGYKGPAWIADYDLKESLTEGDPPHGSPEDELEMMKARTKPAVTFIDQGQYEKLYEPLMSIYNWEVLRFKLPNHPYHSYVIGQPGQKNRIEKIKDLLIKMNSGEISADEHYHRKLGKLLGYPDNDIDQFITNLKENFADGKGPGKPGDSRRHGIPKHATLAQLDKIAKQGGRKGQLAHWQANMRRGRKK